VLIGMKDSQVVDVRPDELAHNKGVICIKGSMLPELVRIPGRLTTPKIRKNGTLVNASWDEAMGLVASKFSEAIREFGPDAVAFYGSGQLFTEESYTANKLFKAGIRTNNVDGNPRLCMASAASGYISTYGKDEPPGCYADADYADCFFIFGANPYECHPPIFERIRQRKRLHPEAAIICVDPRRTMTAHHSDIHLPVVPGTDLLLLNSMANVICEEGLENQQFIEKHVRFSDGEKDCDFARFREFLKAFAPEKVEPELGVSAGDIRRVAFLFARSKATMSLWTMGANQRTQGTFLNNMLNGLHLITGQIGRPGATPFSVTGQPNACGGVRDTGALAHALPNGRLVANPSIARRWRPSGTCRWARSRRRLDWTRSIFFALWNAEVSKQCSSCARTRALPCLQQHAMRQRWKNALPLSPMLWRTVRRSAMAKWFYRQRCGSRRKESPDKASASISSPKNCSRLPERRAAICKFSWISLSVSATAN
jgi:nitrate reductase NapA